MIIDWEIYKNECYVFSGFLLNKEQYKELSKEIEFTEECDSIITNSEFFVGKILVRQDYYPEYLSWSTFDMDVLREYSTNDEVRKIRFTLMRLFPDKFNNEYPKLFIITI
jgi:hypothetical protein